MKHNEMRMQTDEQPDKKGDERKYDL